MIKNGKLACDWCGRTFREDTPRIEFKHSSRHYHVSCFRKVGGRNDMGSTDTIIERTTKNIGGV